MAHAFCVQHHHLRSEVHWIRRYVKQQQQQIPVTQRSTHPHTRAYWTSLSSSRTKRAKVSRCGSVDSVSTDTSSYYCQLTLLRQMLCNSKRRGTDMHQVHFIFTPPLASTHLAPHRPTDRQSKACLCIYHMSREKRSARVFIYIELVAEKGGRRTAFGRFTFGPKHSFWPGAKQFGYVGFVTLQSGAILRELALRSSFIEVVLH